MEGSVCSDTSVGFWMAWSWARASFGYVGTGDLALAHAALGMGRGGP